MGEWKPSTGLGAVALALFVTAVTALSGARHEMTWYAYLFGMVACGTLALVHLGAAGLRAYLGLVEWQERRAPPDEPTPAAPAEPEPDDEPDYLPAWRAAAHRFVTAGNLYGFGVRDIASGDHKVVEWDDWGLMRDFLIEAGVLSPKGGTRWAAGWNWPEWQERYAALPLPPVRVPPPEVELTVNDQRKQRQQQAQQAPRVVEGLRSD